MRYEVRTERNYRPYPVHTVSGILTLSGSLSLYRRAL